MSRTVRPAAAIQSAGTRWTTYTRMWSPPLRWANRPRSPSAAAALPGPTSAAASGCRSSTSWNQASRKATPVYRGMAGETARRTRDQAPSAPTTSRPRRRCRRRSAAGGASGRALDGAQGAAPAHGAGCERVQEEAAQQAAVDLGLEAFAVPGDVVEADRSRLRVHLAHLLPSGRERRRKSSRSPASRRAIWPSSSCRSRVPPWSRASGPASWSYTVTAMPCRCRTRAQVRPPGPAPMTAMRGQGWWGRSWWCSLRGAYGARGAYGHGDAAPPGGVREEG